MDYSPFMILAVLIPIVIQYLLEVNIGCATSMYDSESGLLSEDCLPKKINHSQFLGKLVPLQLAAIGLPLLAYDLLSGVLLILISLLMFCLYRKKPPVRVQRSTTK